MKKILKSILTLGVVAVVAFTGANAFFNDTETSEGNTFVAGSLDLKIDSTAHFNDMICTENGEWHFDPNGQFASDDEVPVGHYPQPGTECGGTWTEKDLGATQDKFFNFTDLKPGDFGETTISLHVYDNDAWGRVVIDNVVDSGNTCTEPETETADTDCSGANPGDPEADGELDENLLASAWIDDGTIPGFQNNPDVDPEEGDNIKNGNEQFLPQTVIGSAPNTIDMWNALSAYRLFLGAQCADSDSNGDGQTGTVGQPETYQVCQGIAVDGRLVGSTTYYMGVDWSLPSGTGNEVQSDSLTADFNFEVEQHRNNPNPFQP